MDTFGSSIQRLLSEMVSGRQRGRRVEEAAATTQPLQDQAGELARTVSVFKIAPHAVRA